MFLISHDTAAVRTGKYSGPKLYTEEEEGGGVFVYT